MRVAIVVQQMRQPVPGGIGTYIRGLVGSLRPAGREDDVDLVLVASRSASKEDPLRAWGEVSATRLGRRSTLVLWERDLLRAPGGSDVLHATSLAFPSPPRNASTVTTMFLHDVSWRTHPELYPRRGHAFHERALLRAVSSPADFLVPSTATADGLLGAGVAASRIHVVGEGCDHLPLVPRLEPGGYLLTVSTQEPRKNLPRLIEAYARIRNRLPEPWPLYIVGPRGWDGRDGGPAKPTPEQPGVRYLGPVSDGELAELLAGARTFAYVPLTEGYGLPPVEAMRAGVPVVASAVPSVSEATAWIADPLDVDDIARGLLEVSTDEQARLSLAAAGTAFARRNTWEAAASAHLRIWADLLDRT